MVDCFVVVGTDVVVLAVDVEEGVVVRAGVAQVATVRPALTAVEQTKPVQQPVYDVGCAAPATVECEHGLPLSAVWQVEYVETGGPVVVVVVVVVVGAGVAQVATVIPALTAVEQTRPVQQPVNVVGCAAPPTVECEQGAARSAD